MNRHFGFYFSHCCFLFLVYFLSPIALSAQDRSQSNINMERIAKKQTSLQWGRDPFVLPMEERDNGLGKALENDLRLSAIINGPGRGVAIINNRILRKGDLIEGVRVVDILQDRVILSDTLGYRELHINSLKLNR